LLTSMLNRVRVLIRLLQQRSTGSTGVTVNTKGSLSRTPNPMMAAFPLLSWFKVVRFPPTFYPTLKERPWVGWTSSVVYNFSSLIR